MLKQTLALILLTLVLTTPASAQNGVKCAFAIEQYGPDGGQPVRLYADTAEFLQDRHVSGFAAGISLDVGLTAVDTLQVKMDVHAHSFAPQPDRSARSFQVEYGLPARLDSIKGKNNVYYRVTLTPLEPIEINEEACPYTHYSVEDFNVDPTAHMNIYYVPQTLGDFHWNAIKGMFEEEYDNFNKMCNFRMPGKYQFYLCPCRLNTVIWDDRFGMMVDPVRSTMFAIYSKSYNSAFPFLVAQAAIYHNYGYAPAFISEGIANYLSFAIFDMKKLVAESELPSVKSLLDTYTYYQTEARISDRISATFVRYLIDQHGIGKFLEWYRQADDLNQVATLESIYGTAVGNLETGWRNYVDTVTVQFTQLGYHAVRAETMLDYRLMFDYSKEMFRLAATRQDSIETLGQLSRAAFFAGDYYAATDYQSDFLKIADPQAGEWMKLAGYKMMNGEYEQAAATLTQAAEYDSASNLVDFNLALNSLFQGDTLQAKQRFNTIVASGAPVARMESQVMLGELLAFSEDKADQASATTLFHSVVGELSRQDQRHNASSTQSMWLGIAYLGIGDIGNADDYLRTALFLETRPFYEGMINLWLGKVADQRGERTLAKQYYSQVLSGSSAHYHQEEANRLLQKPYRR